jgi:uncharacterized membrane protein SpoIIM required for sporulation
MKKVAELLAERHENWAELQRLCGLMEERRKRSLGPELISRFAALYRSACADLALADAYHLPPNTIAYLHQLVGRAHNQLYRSRSFNFRGWLNELLYRVPQRLFHDNYLRVAFVLFFGFFAASYLLARFVPGYSEQTLGKENMEGLKSMYSQPLTGRHIAEHSSMGGFYIYHNAGIGLRCFATGLIFGVVGMIEVIYNAIFLGAAFGFMDTQPEAKNFNEFVTAHGPFELTAIVVSAAAGMRLGFAFIDTQGMTRIASLRRAGREAMPIMASAVILFCLAAFIEGYISPSAAPYWFKALVAVVSGGLMLFYFVLLGLPKPIPTATAADEGTWEGVLRKEASQAPSPKPAPPADGTWEAALQEA